MIQCKIFRPIGTKMKVKGRQEIQDMVGENPISHTETFDSRLVFAKLLVSAIAMFVISLCHGIRVLS